MLHEALVNASDLNDWACRNHAADHLPLLLRRLILATVTDARRVDMPAGEGVHVGGWDGVVQAERGTAFVPEGASVWEMGKAVNPRGKADADYTKRTADPLGVAPAQTAFVFVTPRRWSAKARWERARNAEGVWREVKAYDAEDLATWLDTAPAVHVWISLLLGKRPDGAEDLEGYWRGWSEVTKPRIAPEMLLSGRTDVVRQLQAWLECPPSPIGLHADTADEATAILAAMIQMVPESGAIQLFSRAVVTDTPQALGHVSGAQTPLLIVARNAEQRSLVDAVR